MTHSPTPQYVLLEDGKPLSVQMLCPPIGVDGTMIYAFSDKEPYDRFCATTGRTVCPYPLVKGYLRRQILEQPSIMHYMVVDAKSPSEAKLNIAMMATILESLEQKIAEVLTMECEVAPLIPSTS